VIVESPAKARTIASMLGPDFVVESSVGHVRDLPRSAEEVPSAYKGEPWARLGVDVDNGFKPLYIVTPDKRDVVRRLKARLAEASELYLATDEDREGESIAWHLTEVLSPRVPVKRMVFHEITPSAIRHAVEHPRELDRRLVDAQEARRILDRLYGYEVSPVLWRKVMPRLSAGRVQSVATRLIVERERERMRFRSATWWDLLGRFATHGGGRGGRRRTSARATFEATLVALGGVPIATGRDFGPDGRLAADSAARVLGEEEARALAQALEGAPFVVRSVARRPYRRAPAPPFITSTLQQEAARRLRFSAERTMRVAQRLYEQGWITYMRTDSTTLSDEAIAAARAEVAARFGSELLPASPRRYASKVRNAQEAHEAIRPAGERFRSPEQAASSLSGDDLALYELVWRRTLASQMVDARGTTVQVRVVSPSDGDREEAEFAVAGTVIEQPGFLLVYEEAEDDEAGGSEEGASRQAPEQRLPSLEEREPLEALGFEARAHATQPPPRYTEASLVRALEERGIGRPSTYASIVSTIQERGYVFKKGTALVPSFMAFAVVGLLERWFPELVDYGFTAAMEEDLDRIANGSEEVLPWLTRLYFGDPGGRKERLGLKEAVSAHLAEIDARQVNSIPIGRDSAGRELVVRVGRYGPYLQRGEERVSIPEDLPPDELTPERAEAMLAEARGGLDGRVLGTDPATGLEVVVRRGRFGPYVQLGEAAEGKRPRTASLLKSMSPDSVTLEEALGLLSLPRVLGTDPASGEEVMVANGRFGPYVRCGQRTRSLPDEEALFSIGLDEALALLAAPPRRARSAPAVLRVLGTDAAGRQVEVRTGRYGPYVTDGETNASLRGGDDPDSVTLERALELIDARRHALEHGEARPRRSTRRRAAGNA
jgi:DNA topoisomerase-1